METETAASENIAPVRCNASDAIAHFFLAPNIKRIIEHQMSTVLQY